MTENRIGNGIRRRYVNATEGILSVIILLYCVMVAAVNPAFLSVETLFDIVRSSSTAVIVGMGLLVVMLSGGIDVSFMSIALFGSYVAAYAMIRLKIDSLVFAFAVSVGLGTMLGLVNALLVNWLNLPPFIITLGTQNLFHGVMTTFISDKTFGAGVIPSVLSKFGSATLFTLKTRQGVMGLTAAVIPMCIAVLLTWFIVCHTMVGRGVVAMGNSPESARRAGFNLLKLRLFVYGYIGALAAVMGVVYISQVNAVYPNKLVGNELMIIAGAVIGGVKDTGGRGKILGVILGIAIIYLLNSTLIFMGLSSSWNNFFVGTLLVVSVAVTSWQSRRRNRKNLLFAE
jgi:simple sugar transport system permease protein